MKKYIYPMALAATLLTTTGCSDDEVNDAPVIPDDQKEMISFSVSDGTDLQTRVGFREADTRILMRIQSDDRHSTNPGSTRYTRALALATKDEMDISTDANKAHAYSEVSVNSDPRYWDDAFGRYAYLSVYAIAIANKNSETLLPLSYMYDGTGSKSLATNTSWGTSEDAAKNTIEFTVEKAEQTATTIANQDLVYSNNIQNDASLGKDGVYRWNFTDNKYLPEKTGKTIHENGRMLFYQDAVNVANEPSDAPGHFDKGHLVFKHALSRLTVTLVEGDGFDKTSENKDKDFKFNSGNIKLLGMNTTGTLDVKTGLWTAVTATSIDKMSPASTYTTAAGTYAAQMLPDYIFNDGNTTNVMEFTIDDNIYYVTQDMIYDALVAKAENKVAGYGYTEGKFKMMQGHNYCLTITVKKKAIDVLTATLADWTDVEGEYALDNSHITVTTLKIDGVGDKPCREFNFYRYGETLDKIYADDTYSANSFSGDYKKEGNATLTETATNSNIWNTNWFYESNKIAYHFRTLNNLAANGSGAANSNIENTGNPAISSFTMESGTQSTHDYHWGAPMNEGAGLKYDLDEGFSSSIHKGIVSPKNGVDNTINITELHMMSNISITLVTDSVSTPTKAKGPAAVNLENAEITITRFAKTGKVDMGTGLISPNYTAPTSDPVVHNLAGDVDCAKIDAPSFTDGWWKDIDNGSVGASTGRYSYAVVPQALRRTSSDTPTEAECVGLTIRTSDNNEYYVIKDLATILATAVTTNSSLIANRNQNVNDPILRWFPGYSYHYTIKITKKGIEAITCTVADWVNVEAEEIKIDLES